MKEMSDNFNEKKQNMARDLIRTAQTYTVSKYHCMYIFVKNTK